MTRALRHISLPMSGAGLGLRVEGLNSRVPCVAKGHSSNKEGNLNDNGWDLDRKNHPQFRLQRQCHDLLDRHTPESL